MELKSGSMTDIDSEVVIVRLRLIAKYRNTLEEFNLLASMSQVIFASNLLLKDLYSQWLKLQQILIHIFWCSYIKLVRQHTLTLFIEGTQASTITPELAAKLQSAGMRNILVHQYKDRQLVFCRDSKSFRPIPTLCTANYSL